MRPVVGLMAKKIGMSRVMDNYGDVVAVTLLSVEKQQVTKLISQDKHGYTGYQVGYFEKAEKNLNRPDVFRLRKSGLDTLLARFCEFRTDKLRPNNKKNGQEESQNSLTVGQLLSASDLDGVTHLDVSGLTKGRGFQGSTKRWNSKIAPMSHGSRYHRRTGSLGNCTTPGRVMPGKKMPGQYGYTRKTLKSLAVFVIDKEKNLIAVKGALPGNRGSTLEVRVAGCCL
ncbi:MAG: 50S ribosomal protein L3 [Proteobacteria bacterium]|nr:50S ribosomal protein L3 [Pseudomonadota bacterium]